MAGSLIRNLWNFEEPRTVSGALPNAAIILPKKNYLVQICDIDCQSNM